MLKRLTIARWFEARWRAFQASYDPDEVLSVTTPRGTIFVTLVFVGVTLVLGFVPAVSATANVQQPFTAIALALLAACTSLVSARYRCRGRIGTPATLFDSLLWSTALMYLTVNTHSGYATGLAVIYALAVLSVPVQFYSLTLLFGLAEILPSALLLAIYRPDAAVTLIASMTAVLILFLSHATGERRRLLKRQRTLEQAFGAADKIVDESMQAALATMLLSLGHFLHELRNYQTAIATNLAYLEETAQLDEQGSEALRDTKLVQAAEQKLVYDTIEDLKRRSRPVNEPFVLSEALRQAAAGASDVSVLVDERNCAGFRLLGNPQHLGLVLHNLIRNAAQAGATEVHLDVAMEPSGNAVRLVVHDNGPGIAASQRDRIFQPFVSGNTLESAGIGLYLCRRYVGLFGGTVSVEEGPLGGAAFVINLPSFSKT